MVGDVNLAAGGILGSCLFNLLLLALLDAISGRTPLLKRAEISQVLAAGLGGVLLTGVMVAIYVSQTLRLPAIGWIGAPTLLIIGGYCISVRIISFFEKRRVQEVLEQQAVVYQYAAIPLWRAIVVFVGAAAAIAGLGLWLAALVWFSVIVARKEAVS